MAFNNNKTEARLTALIVSTTAAFATLDVIYSRDSNVSVDPHSYLEFAKAMAMMAAIYVVTRLVDWRIEGDDHRVAKVIRRGSEAVRVVAINSALFIPLAFASVVFMYLAAATNRPLLDGTLAEFDTALGVHWPALLGALNAYPTLSGILLIAYHSLGPQVPLLFLILALAGRAARLREFLALLAISSVFTAALMAVVPAAGAYAYFQPDQADFGNFTAMAGMWHYEELMRLRSGEPFNLLVTNGVGLVTFPSYHTALGILVVYALRDFRLLAWCVGSVNAIMIVSTLPEGGHHFIDVIAGLGVGLGTILIVAGLQRDEQAKGTLAIDGREA